MGHLMLKYKCGDCGYVFDPDEAFICTEILDYIDGQPYKETYPVCPMCGGQFDEFQEKGDDYGDYEP